MQENSMADFDVTIYYNQSVVTTCKPDHVGFMGIFFEDVTLGYPVGTLLEIKFVGHKYQYLKDVKTPVIVNHSDASGTGLRLENFDKDVIQNWEDTLHEILKSIGTVLNSE